jgi:D-alanyl-D-alanine carboxypeptidase
MRVRLFAAALLVLNLAASPMAAAGPALLFDASDGKVLYAEDLDNQWHPASLTKIMTAYLTFEAIKEGKLTLDQKLPVSELATQQPPSKLGVVVGAQILVESALKAVIIKSANDISVVLAEAISGSDVKFVAKMNETARRLGMTRTQFVNPNGLPAPEQMTTARDLAKLARAVIKDYPQYASYWSMDDAHIGKIRIATHNGLLHSFDGADGMKTGFICDSGFNVVASATRDGRQLIAVVLGEPTGRDRTYRAATLLEHGFQSYGWKMLFDPPNIDSAPIAADAKGVMSVRQNVISVECGTGARRANKAKSKKPKKPRPANEASIKLDLEPGAELKATKITNTKASVDDAYSPSAAASPMAETVKTSTTGIPSPPKPKVKVAPSP